MTGDLAAPDLPTPLVPGFVLPAQLERARGTVGAVGERALMLAVLEDAIRCLQEHRGGVRAGASRLAREAAAWIRSNAERPFSFVGVCDALDIPAAELRAVLLGWCGPRGPGDVAPRRYRLNLRAVGRRVNTG